MSTIPPELSASPYPDMKVMGFVEEMQLALAGSHEPHYWGCTECGAPLSHFSASVREFYAYQVYADPDGHLEVDYDADGNCYDSILDSIACDECSNHEVKPIPVSAMPKAFIAGAPKTETSIHVISFGLRKSDYVPEEALAAWFASHPEG